MTKCLLFSTVFLLLRLRAPNNLDSPKVLWTTRQLFNLLDTKPAIKKAGHLCVCVLEHVFEIFSVPCTWTGCSRLILIIFLPPGRIEIGSSLLDILTRANSIADGMKIRTLRRLSMTRTHLNVALQQWCWQLQQNLLPRSRCIAQNERD